MAYKDNSEHSEVNYLIDREKVKLPGLALTKRL